MWKKWLKVAGIAALVLAILAASALSFAAWLGERKLQRTVEVRVVPVPYVRGPTVLKLGKYLFESRGCSECHGADGRGIAFIDSPGGMYVKSPNITTGPGGVVSDYNEGDWVRAIRHGVNPKGHALILMPGVDYNRMNDADLAALVAYTRNLAPVAGESTVFRLPMMVKALYGLGVIRDSAERIDHRKPPSQPVAAAVTAQYGAYVANMCVGCHGASLSGGKIAGAPAQWPPAANLTPGEGSVMPAYDSAQTFVTMMRTGRRPDGSQVSNAMPFMSLRNFNDLDLAALYVYLNGMAPKKMGEP
jgi:mono/diheme cytochrome c family protein